MPLKHFVYIIQENITFDHYFGTFPGVNGIPKGAKFAYQPGQTASIDAVPPAPDFDPARPEP